MDFIKTRCNKIIKQPKIINNGQSINNRNRNDLGIYRDVHILNGT